MLAIISAAGYATLAIFVKWAYDADFSALDILAWRYIFAVIIVWGLWPFVKEAAPLKTISRQQFITLFGLGILFAGVSLMAVLALDRIPATTYTLILYTYPAMVAILSFMLGERLPPLAWVSVGLALIGCSLTAGGSLKVSKPADLLFPLANAASYSIYLIIAGKRTRQIPGMTSGILSLTGTALVVPFLILAQGLEIPDAPNEWGIVIGMASLSTVLPILTLFAGIARIGASNAAILSTIEPLITIVLAAILLREEADTLQYLGGGLILVSVFMLQAAMRKSTPASEKLAPE